MTVSAKLGGDPAGTAASAVAAHEADTTNVHGITDTSTLYRSGGTDVAVADGGTGASTAVNARKNLGVDGGDGVVKTFDARLATSVAATGGASRTQYTRMRGSKTGATTFVIYVGTSSGNISVAIFPNNGSNGTAARPSGNRKATTGEIACPAGSAFATVTFLASVDIDDGDWLAISMDNTTATFARTAMVASGAGVAYVETSAHPAPTSVGTLLAAGSAFFGSSE